MFRFNVIAVVSFLAWRGLAIGNGFSSKENIVIPVTLSRIDNATIFSSSSFVEIYKTYIIDANLIPYDEKEQYITFSLKNLPISIDEQSIRIIGADIDNESSLSILGSHIVYNSTAKENDAEYKKFLSLLESELASNVSKYNHLNLELNRLSKRLTLIDHIVSNSSIVNANTYPSISSLLDVVDGEIIKTSEKFYENNQSAALVNATIAQLNSALCDLKNRGLYDYNGVKKTFTSKNSLDLNLLTKLKKSDNKKLSWAFHLSYIINPASWVPNYDIKIGSSGTKFRKYKLTIDYYASISQDTEEDWDNVSLVLSSSQPQEIETATFPLPSGIGFQNMQYNQNRQAEDFSNRKNRKHIKSSSRSSPNNQAYSESAAMDYAVEPSQGMAFLKIADVARASVSSQGDLSSSYLFTVPYSVSLKSSKADNGLRPSSIGDHKLLIDSLQSDVLLFSYAIPSKNNGALLRLYGKHSFRSSFQEGAIPILPSFNARVILQGSYIGSKPMPLILPSETMLLDLGRDANIQISNFHVLSRNSGKEEDKSTWFVQDKKEFNVRTKESVITAKNLDSQGMKLIILAENLPKSAEQDITVKLVAACLTPACKLTSISSLTNSKTVEYSVDEDLVEMILERENKAVREESEVKPSVRDALIVQNPITNTIFWIKWLAPGEEYRTTLKYEIVWPRDQAITFF